MALPEACRDPVVHVVRREPVHAPDIDAQPLQEALAHLVPTELLAFLLRLNLEAKDQRLLEEKLDELKQILGEPAKGH